jgi:hypothetical protein
LTFTNEQLDAQLLLHLLEPGRQVRWHAVQALGSAGDGALFRHGLENAQLTELHTFLQN